MAVLYACCVLSCEPCPNPPANMLAGSAKRMGMQKFLFATGIESSYPVIAGPDGKPMRIDEMQKTGHYERWKDDLALVRTLGIDALR